MMLWTRSLEFASGSSPYRTYFRRCVRSEEFGTCTIDWLSGRHIFYIRPQVRFLIHLRWKFYKWIRLGAYSTSLLRAIEDNKIAVFNKGICKGLNGRIPVGGHNDPISIVGDNLLWKKAQKNERKKNTSEIIKRIIPHRNPLVAI